MQGDLSHYSILKVPNGDPQRSKNPHRSSPVPSHPSKIHEVPENLARGPSPCKKTAVLGTLCLTSGSHEAAFPRGLPTAVQELHKPPHHCHPRKDSGPQGSTPQPETPALIRPAAMSPSRRVMICQEGPECIREQGPGLFRETAGLANASGDKNI